MYAPYEALLYHLPYTVSHGILTKRKSLQTIFYPNPYLQIRLYGVVASAPSGRLFYITNYTNSLDKLQFFLKRRYLIWQAEIGL